MKLALIKWVNAHFKNEPHVKISCFDFGINIPDDDEEFTKLCEGRDERFGTEFTIERDIVKLKRGKLFLLFPYMFCFI